MLIGYARVSTVHQNLERQLGSLRAVGCTTIYAEKASGKDVKGRPELESAIDALGTGDVFVLAEWDRATRSMADGITIMQRVHARGAAIIAFVPVLAVHLVRWMLAQLAAIFGA